MIDFCVIVFSVSCTGARAQKKQSTVLSKVASVANASIKVLNLPHRSILHWELHTRG